MIKKTLTGVAGLTAGAYIFKEFANQPPFRPLAKPQRETQEQQKLAQTQPLSTSQRLPAGQSAGTDQALRQRNRSVGKHERRGGVISDQAR